MSLLFWRQFKALSFKNFIVFRKHWLVNLLRCLIFPLALGIFLAFVTNLFAAPNDKGLGTAVPIARVEDHFDGSRPIIWADTTDGNGYITATQIMSHVTSKFTSIQLAAVKKAKDPQELDSTCLTNFNGVSPCYLTVTFEGIPTASKNDLRAINYTMRMDSAVDIVDWAIDGAIVELTTGKQVPTTLQWPFTTESNEDSAVSRRYLWLSMITSFGALAFILAFTGIVYQLTGAVSLERASLLTSHMQAMGALDSARLLSWHLSTSLLYVPIWIILALVWHSQLFVNTNAGLIILVHIITGLGLASWSLFISVPFSKSPQVAAVIATGFAIVVGLIPIMVVDPSNTLAGILSFFFPSVFYTFALISIIGFERYPAITNATVADPKYGIVLLPMMIAALVGIVVWPCLAILLERAMYGVPNSASTNFWRRKNKTESQLPPGVAMRLRNVNKTFVTSLFRGKASRVTAISDLTIDIPTYGICVLLGANGAGKSTALGILGGLTKATKGEVLYEGNLSRPSHGTLGIVPQKNVLFPELSCIQTLRVWHSIKAADNVHYNEDLEQLLRDCDLQSKCHASAGTLSGGQKRKLQLAIGLVGGSKVILVDECTSGVDPLSRRALWKTLTTYRNERTILLTTHFLDEADFLADHIAVLAAPGKLVASDTPVALKSTMGEGYSILVKFVSASDVTTQAVLQAIQSTIPDAWYTAIDDQHVSYHLKTRDTVLIAKAIRLVEEIKVQSSILSYDVLGTTIEDIFLDLLQQDELEHASGKETSAPTLKLDNLNLSNGRSLSPMVQALTVFHKRVLISRRSWLVPLLALAVAILGATWPMRFIKDGVTGCGRRALRVSETALSLFPPRIYNSIAAPPSLAATFNATFPELFYFNIYTNETVNPFQTLPDEAAFTEYITTNLYKYTNEGGSFMDFDANRFIVAYQIHPLSLQLFSLASNLFYNRALNSSTSPSGSRRIIASYGMLPPMSVETLFSLRWLVIFGAAMSVFPAFFTIYVAKERHSRVQAMQLANGLANPLGLWLGHFMFDSIITVIAATVIAIVYGTVKEKFQGIGVLWLVICLYGFAGTLMAYIVAIFVKSPIGAFSTFFVSQFLIYLAYISGSVATLYSELPYSASTVLNIIHFTVALVSPIISLIRAAFVSINQFSLLCEGDTLVTGPGLVSITRYGGPILYLVLWILVLLGVLGHVDSGLRLPWAASIKRRTTSFKSDLKLEKRSNYDVLTETEHALSPTTRDPLRVLNVSKSFDGNKVVDDISFTIPHKSLFVMVGPNGAGKTTTFDMIHGQQQPDSGDVKVNNTSVVLDTKKARVSFGVCPQFTAIDSHLTVREHLLIYGRLKGLDKGQELQSNIDSLLAATGLSSYTNRMARKLSGGNQRKLALAIALIGNPPVILIDEFSTGIDAKMKRELWTMLKHVMADKSVFLTTHSMEEASYLATKVGIMSRRLLAVGTPEELESRNASYEVHFSCRSRQDFVQIQSAMADIPGARMVDDVATRFEVPIGITDDIGGIESIAELFEILSKLYDFPEFTVEKSTLETAFIKIINEDAEAADNLENTPKKSRLWGLV
ncbi:hypothetical protein B0H34DRAFT_792024 [Crassisporium funariophilum]|nr:hypothetical protein B0H34DRAFT_792024 [Crassisporium funariophilum]